MDLGIVPDRIEDIVTDAHEIGRGNSRYLSRGARDAVEYAPAGRLPVGAGYQGYRDVVNGIPVDGFAARQFGEREGEAAATVTERDGIVVGQEIHAMPFGGAFDRHQRGI